VSLNKLLTIAVAVWAILVLGTLGVRLALFNAPLNLQEILGWLLIGCTPAVVALLVLRGRSTPSVAQVLYDVEHPVAVVPPRPRENDAQR